MDKKKKPSPDDEMSKDGLLARLYNSVRFEENEPANKQVEPRPDSGADRFVWSPGEITVTPPDDTETADRPGKLSVHHGESPGKLQPKKDAATPGA